MTDWQESQYQDECVIQQEIVEALDHAKELGLSDDELQLLAWAAGVRETFNHNLKHTI